MRIVHIWDKTTALWNRNTIRPFIDRDAPTQRWQRSLDTISVSFKIALFCAEHMFHVKAILNYTDQNDNEIYDISIFYPIYNIPNMFAKTIIKSTNICMNIKFQFFKILLLLWLLNKISFVATLTPSLLPVVLLVKASKNNGKSSVRLTERVPPPPRPLSVSYLWSCHIWGYFAIL